jgi:hypothetical protein
MLLHILQGLKASAKRGVKILSHIGMDHKYSVVKYLVLYFRLRIGNQSFIEKGYDFDERKSALE